MTSRPRSGFSLIEALVVLAIGGMALAIIFSIGIKAGDTGFGLGRRAMTVADADVSTGDLRAILHSVALRPSELFNKDLDTPVSGRSDRFEADVVMERSTQCAPQGWAGRLTLTIEDRQGSRTLTCTAGGKTTVLAKTGQRPAQFSYSTNRRDWSPTFSNAPRGGPRPEEIYSEAIWIRFSAPPGIDVVERAGSGRPEAWIRPDDDF